MNEAVIISGTVSKVSFSEQKDKAYVEFKDEGNFVFEFSNKKKPRADHIKKMRLQAGEKVVAIGALSGASNAYGFGYDIVRAGRINKSDFAMISGTIEKKVETSTFSLLYVRSDPKAVHMIVCKKDDLVDIPDVGEKTFCLCKVKPAVACQGQCKSSGQGKCKTCSRIRNQKRYIALSIEGENL